MCTYLTEKVQISGSGKGPAGWFKLTDASVYFDHPVHAQAEHTLNIDFLDPGAGPSARVAVELTAESARALAQAIQATLDAAPPGLVSLPYTPKVKRGAGAKAKGPCSSAFWPPGGFTVPDDVRQRIQSCADIAQLDAWGERAVTAKSFDEIFTA